MAQADMDWTVGGSGLDAVSAATLHKKWVAQVSPSISIGSPAVARGGQAWMRVCYFSSR
jgi:hypothetical protein